jgi:hypothetical protein
MLWGFSDWIAVLYAEQKMIKKMCVVQGYYFSVLPFRQRKL